MSWQTCFLRVSARWPVSFKRIPALPEMLVRGDGAKQVGAQLLGAGVGRLFLPDAA